MIKANCGCIKNGKYVSYCAFHQGYAEGYHDASSRLPMELPFDEDPTHSQTEKRQAVWDGTNIERIMELSGCTEADIRKYIPLGSVVNEENEE